ncbi:MAG: hypothetical protein U0R68_14305 [Candidatus Nanopelagicales bacterium]
MTTDSGLPEQVPIWQRSFLPEDLPPAPPVMPATAAPPPPAPLSAPPVPLSALPAPTATPLSALPPPTGPAYGAPAVPAPGYPSTAYAAPPPSAPVAPNRFGILPDPAYDVPAATPYGAPAASGSWPASRPSIMMPIATPKGVVTAGRWGRARGILGLVVGGLMLMASFAGSAGDAFNGMLLMLLAVLQLVWAMGWLVAGQRTIEGSRGAAQAMRVLAFADIAFVMLSVVVLGDTATRGVLGCAIDVYIIVTMFGGEASRWLAGRR